jgi:hypothetical protein
MSCFDCSLGTVNQAQVDYGTVTTLDLPLDCTEITAKALLQPIELRPVGLQAKSRQAYAKFSDCTLHLSPSTLSSTEELMEAAD